jgi:hypothetical protein
VQLPIVADDTNLAWARGLNVLEFQQALSCHSIATPLDDRSMQPGDIAVAITTHDCSQGATQHSATELLNNYR